MAPRSRSCTRSRPLDLALRSRSLALSLEEKQKLPTVGLGKEEERYAVFGGGSGGVGQSGEGVRSRLQWQYAREAVRRSAVLLGRATSRSASGGFNCLGETEQAAGQCPSHKNL